jgi:hypothetical protein
MVEQGTTVAETYREAYDNGFRDGRDAGRQDRQNDRLFDLANRREYQQADNGFDGDRHDREVYLVAYRRGFEDGYEEGYGLATSSGDEETSTATRADPPRTKVRRDRPDLPPGSSTRAFGQLPVGTRVEIQLRDTLSTKYSERGDSFRARVVEDVHDGQRVVIPRGTRIEGEVAYSKRAGRIRGRAQINLRFDELRLPDGRRISFEAKVVDIERQSPEKVKEKGDEGTIVAPGGAGEDAKGVGKKAGVGGVIGVITGGRKGAAIGATAGAVAGLAGILMTRGRDAVLESGTELTIELIADLNVPSERP